MERSKAKEAGRRKYIREKARALKEAPPRKAPARSVMKQVGRYRAIETARKQLTEAQQTIAPDQEQQPYTAVDKVEDYAGSIAHDLVQLPVPASERRRQAAKKNAFHRETHFEPDEAEKSAKRTKEQMRRSYVREVREQTDYHTAEKDAVEQPFSRGFSAHNAKRREKIARAQHITSTATQPNPTQSTGQRQMALPHNTSTASTSKVQLVKEQGRRYARNQAIQEIKNGTTKRLSGKAAKASGDFFKKLGTAITKAVTPSRETLLYAAGALVLTAGRRMCWKTRITTIRRSF